MDVVASVSRYFRWRGLHRAPITMQGLSIYTFEDGLIRTARDYWNYMEIVRAVGVLPRELRDYRTA